MASDVFFTTNPAEFTRLEGLYVSERKPPGFIRGANLSTVAIAGVCVRGPLTPQVINSTARFLEVYGGRDYGATPGGNLVGEVWASLLNKPFGQIVVRRVAASDAVKASLTLETGVDGLGTAIVRVDAANVGLWGNSVYVRVEAASDSDANHFNLRVKYLGVETLYRNLDCSAGSTQGGLDSVLGDDVGNLITLTKLADGRPATFSTITAVAWEAADTSDDFMLLGTTIAGYTSVAGANGSLAAGDYNTAMTELAYFEGPSIVMCAGLSVSQSSLNGTIVTLAAAVSDRVFCTWAGVHGQAVATEITNVGTHITTRSDRIIWCYNSTYTLDPNTGLEIQRGPHEWMASILSQNDVDIHPGAQQTANQTAGIRRLTSALTRADLISLRDAGISSLERLPENFLFRSGRTTSLVAGLEEITRRRMADFLQLSAASRLRYFVKAKNTIETRAQMGGELVAFSRSLRDQNRIIEEFEVDQESVNTANQRAQGIEKILWRVRLIGHILHLVLETEIGTGVVIQASL